jgi:Microtubule-binding calmodulin-regulated spectrin-associated
VAKSNRPIVMNAVEYVVFPGAVNKETRQVATKISICMSFKKFAGKSLISFSPFFLDLQ